MKAKRIVAFVLGMTAIASIWAVSASAFTLDYWAEVYINRTSADANAWIHGAGHGFITGDRLWWGGQGRGTFSNLDSGSNGCYCIPRTDRATLGQKWMPTNHAIITGNNQRCGCNAVYAYIDLYLQGETETEYNWLE